MTASEVMTRTRHGILYSPRHDNKAPPSELWELIRDCYCEAEVSKEALATRFGCSVNTIGKILNSLPE